MSMQRQFTSGSRQAPDPFDQFLEENNFYRKHTARDASCLFRVISEQMYGTQLHHLAIRKKCVLYMRKHREFFAPLIERDLDEYLDDLSKPKTYGTLIELQAVGYMFQRNVLLFEPFNLGNFFSTRSYFNDVFRVFYTPERHFDSVFTCDYIKDAAICQAICYEILYEDLYKLPDVAFAVEQMLHSPTLETNEYTSENNENGYCTRIQFADGRSFQFDLPNDTNCILENYELCHFHYTNFPRLSDDLQREMKMHTNCDDYEKSALCKTAESLLPHKYISCVRQLLHEGITPFPYKVAKALDPNMYRNIEFDAWNEQRKEQKLQNWYNGDANFKVGAKCHVKLCKSENDLYTCHIQEIAVDKGYCVVFVEQLGEKRLVPYDSLTPLPPDQFKPWTLPYRFQRHMQKYSSMRLTRHYNYRFKLNGGQFGNGNGPHDYCPSITTNGIGSESKTSSDYITEIAGEHHHIDKDEKQHYLTAAGHNTQNSGCYYKLKQFTHFENFRAHTVEYCAMPLTVEHAIAQQQRDLETKHGGSCNGGALAMTMPSNNDPNNNHSPHGVEMPRGTPTNPTEMRIKTEANVQNIQMQHMGSGGGGGCVAAPEEMMMTGTNSTFNGMEHPAAGLSAPAFIIPDVHYFYPAPPPYGAMPEEYYAYGYDPTLHSPHTATALMSTGYYAMYPPPPPGTPSAAFAPTPNGLYMQAAAGPPLPPPLITAGAGVGVGAPHMAGCGGVGGGPIYQPHTPYSNGTPVHANDGVNAGGGRSAQQICETPNNHRNFAHGQLTNTPLSGRINWDAKKSVDTGGLDLPTDVATLRHFYNLGLEYHLMQSRRCGNDAVNATKSNAAKTVTKTNSANKNDDVVQEANSDANHNSMTKLNGNLPKAANQNGNPYNGAQSAQNQQHANDNNNNTCSNTNNNSNGANRNGGGATHNMHRRYPARFFNNNKERPVFLRNHNNSNNNNFSSNNNRRTNISPNQHLSNHKSDYNNNNNNGSGNGNASGGGNNKHATNLKPNYAGQTNLNRSSTPNSTHSHTSAKNATNSIAIVSGSSTNGTPMPQNNNSYENPSSGGVGVDKNVNRNSDVKILKQESPLPATYQMSQANPIVAAGSYSPYCGEFNGGEPPSLSVMPPPPTTAAGSIYWHMPMSAAPGAPFGIYAPPPPLPPHSANGMQPTPTSSCTPIPYPTPPNGGPSAQHYMMPTSPTDALAMQGPPPSNGFYAAPAEFSTAEPLGLGGGGGGGGGGDGGGGGGGGGGGDGIQFQCVPYAAGAPPPQPMPFYYTTNGAAAITATGGGMPMNNLVQQPTQLPGGSGGGFSNGIMPPAQGYWCQPSNALLPLPAASTPQKNGSGACFPATQCNAATNANRSRENK